MTDLATLVVKLEAQTAAYQQGLQQAQNQLKSFQSSVEGIFDQLKSVAVEFLGAAALEEFTRSVIDNEQELDKLSIQTGIAVDQLSKLQYAAGQNDVSNFSGDILKLSKSIGEANNGNKQLLLDFDALGISAADLKSLSVDQVLQKMADGFKAAADGSGKAAVATALMGRGGQDLIAFLDQGSSGIQSYMDKLEKLGGVVTPEAADQAHKLGQALGDLKAALDGTGQKAVSAFIDPLTDATKALADFFAETRDTGSFDVLSGSVKVLATALITLIYSFESVGSLVKESFIGVGKQIMDISEIAADALAGNYTAAAIAFKTSNADLAADDAKSKADQKARDEAYADSLGKIWYSAAQRQEDAAADAANKVKNINQDLFALIDSLSKKQISLPDAAAITSLETAISGLKDKAKDLDLSASLSNTNEAMARVSLSAGKLADDVKKAGTAGPALAAQYLAAARQVDAATANLTLSKMTDSLKTQLVTFGLSKSAIDQYNLSIGVTGKQLHDLPDHGAAALKSIQDLDRGLEAIQDQQALIETDAELDKLAGHAASSTAALFDLAHAKDIANKQDLGDQDGLDKLQHLKDLTVAQAQFNDLEKQASDIQAQEALSEDAINRKVAEGAETELQGIIDINAARQAEITQLQGVQTGLQTITDQYGKDIPDLVIKTNQFKNSIADVQSKTKDLANTFRNDFIDDANNAWTDFITGAKSASDALKEFLDDFAKQILQMADKNLLQSLFNTGGSGGGGDIFTSLAGLFTKGGPTVPAGGGSDDVLEEVLPAGGGLDGLAVGGPANAGTPYIVGEHGPELMVPKTSGTVVPNGKWGGQQVTQNITVQAPAGTVSKTTQLQVGASASRSLQLANRRNN